MNRKPLALVAATAAVATLTLVGCAGDEKPAYTQKPEAVTSVSNMPGEVQGYEGAAQDATTTKCEGADGKWGVAGTITSSADAARDYRIYVSLLDGADTVGLVQVDVPGVEPGTTHDWATTVDVTGENLQCVLRVERFAPGGQPAASEQAPEGDTATEAPAEGEPTEG